MIYLFLLFIADYFLTFYGIRIGAIYESNPLWVVILNLPLYLGLPFRLLYFTIIVYLPLRFALRNPDKCRKSFVKIFYGVAISINVFILGMHVHWIVSYVLFHN